MLDSRVSRTANRRAGNTSAGTRPASTAPRAVRRTSDRTHAGTGTRAIPSTRSRSMMLLIVLILCGSGVISRLAYWQVLQHGHLSLLAAREHAALAVQTASRGQILDALGNPLATDITMNQVYAIAKDMKDPALTAQRISPLVNVPVTTLEHWFNTIPGYILLKDKADGATSKAIRKLGLPGIVLAPILERYYPAAENAAHEIGFVGGNNRGDAGLEEYYDTMLAGTAGLRSVLKDTAGNDIRVGSDATMPAQNGATLHLSINGVVQSYAEDALAAAVKKHRADGGSIIVMDPRTGYILGMANSPTYNPNHYGAATSTANPAVEDIYEPGSTFKILTMAAGLDAHVITPDTSFDDTGNFYVGDGQTVLHNWNMSGFGIETMTQVLQHSANVGAAWVARRLGTDTFYKYVRAFHIGQQTGVDLPNESPGQVWMPNQKNWTIVNQYTNAFGQGLAVTPLQMIRAVATVANGGVMMKPQIVRSIDYRGRVISHPPVQVGRVIAPATAHTLTNMLVHSAIDGEASLALLKGYDIAAKTGTSNVPGPNGQYIPNDTIASVVGYAPAYHPRFIVLVKIDHPRDTIWGSMAAAPVLHDMFQDLFMYYHVPPDPYALNQ